MPRAFSMSMPRLLPALPSGASRAAAAALVAFLLLCGCQAASGASDQPVVHARSIPLHTEQPDAVEVGRLRFEAGYALSSSDERFGGFSGLWIADDGERMIAASDRGHLWTARLDHDDAGRLVGLRQWEVLTLGRRAGDPEAGNAEALALDDTGGLVIAFEGEHRLRRWAFENLGAAPTSLPVPERLDPGNQGIEALVDLRSGELLAFAEELRDDRGDLFAWLIRDDAHHALSYVTKPGFAPTGADRLEGTVYLVERAFSVLGGFRARILALPAAQIRPAARLAGVELARLDPPLVVDNFEALAARRGPNGRTLLYLLSDDNFFPLQRTLLLQFSVVPAVSGGGPDDRVGRAHERPEG